MESSISQLEQLFRPMNTLRDPQHVPNSLKTSPLPRRWSRFPWTQSTQMVDSVVACNSAPRSHLYVVVHGFNSRPEHMKFIADQLQQHLGPQAAVHVAVCNRSKGPALLNNLTHDGIDMGGHRLAHEIQEVVRRFDCCGLRFISIIGNSLGGLFARYAIGVLFDSKSRKICGLEPVSFVTTASPHLGLHGFVPKLFESVTSSLHLVGGNTAEQMFLADKPGLVRPATPKTFGGLLSEKLDTFPTSMSRRHSHPKPVLARDFRRLPTPRARPPPIQDDWPDPPTRDFSLGGVAAGDEFAPVLLAMTTNCPWPFIEALSAFHFRVLYGNTCNDVLVPYPTATISSGELPDWQRLGAVSPRFPHIIHDSFDQVQNWPPPASLALSGAVQAPASQQLAPQDADAEKGDMVVVMRGRLSALGWRRVSARFVRSFRMGGREAPLPGILGLGVDAHNHMPVVRPLLNATGRDTVEHLCQVLLDHAQSADEGRVPLSTLQEQVTSYPQ